MNVKDERLYLYKTITNEKSNKIIDLKSFCEHNDIVLLYEKDEYMFPSNEEAYFIIYPDDKACIVINTKVPVERKKEIGFYSVFKIIKYRLNKKLDSSMHKFYDGKIMTSFYSEEGYIWNKKYIDKICLNLTEEVLLPSKFIPIDIYKVINSHKIREIAKIFEISQELVERRCSWLTKKTKNLIDSINI